MSYCLKTAVWELTMACNMRCLHCGSACKEGLSSELNTNEALRLCDGLAELGLQFVTLSGGEPLLRKDWPVIAGRLSSQGVIVNMISNGWLIDDKVIDLASETGLRNLAVSLDGLEDTHDKIRCKGSFGRILSALELMQNRNFPSAVITTVIKRNLKQLNELLKILEDFEVEFWQFQFGLPMGNLDRKEVINPQHLEDIVEFAYDMLENSSVKPYITDCLGYYSKKTMDLREAMSGSGKCWNGCHAGKASIGILHDGGIVGCTSIRDRQFVEGNIRETPIREIWLKPGAFAWNRGFTRDRLEGFCKKCQFGEICLGGCKNVKLTMTGSFDENPYCIYRVAIDRLAAKINIIHDVDKLIARSRKAVELSLFEVAEMCLSKAQVLDKNNTEVLKLLGYVCYKLKDYERSCKMNKKAVAMNPMDVYCQKGLGVSLAKLGQTDEGVTTLKKAIAITNEKYMDPYNDLAVILLENGNPSEAVEILDQGRNISSEFREESEVLYQTCLVASNNLNSDQLRT